MCNIFVSKRVYYDKRTKHRSDLIPSFNIDAPKSVTECLSHYILASHVFTLTVFHTDQDDPSSSDDEGMPYTRPAKFKAAHSFKGPFDFDQIKVVQDLSGEHMVGVCACVCARACVRARVCVLWPIFFPSFLLYIDPHLPVVSRWTYAHCTTSSSCSFTRRYNHQPVV